MSSIFTKQLEEKLMDTIRNDILTEECLSPSEARELDSFSYSAPESMKEQEVFVVANGLFAFSDSQIDELKKSTIKCELGFSDGSTEIKEVSMFDYLTHLSIITMLGMEVYDEIIDLDMLDENDANEKKPKFFGLFNKKKKEPFEEIHY